MCKQKQDIMKKNWTGTIALILVVLLLIALGYNRIVKKDNLRDKIKTIEAINKQLNDRMDSMQKAVGLRDKVILKQIDSAYYFIGVLNERKMITSGQINAVKEQLDQEKARRKALLDSLK